MKIHLRPVRHVYDPFRSKSHSSEQKAGGTKAVRYIEAAPDVAAPLLLMHQAQQP